MWEKVKKFSPLYKYGIPALLAFIILTFAIRDTTFYSMWYQVIGELITLSFCAREGYEASRRHKCKWQVASILGVASYCILNIIYFTNGKNEAIMDYQWVGFFVFGGASIYYLIKEQYYANKDS